MPQGKIRGETQIMPQTITNAEILNSTITLAKLADGADILLGADNLSGLADMAAARANLDVLSSTEINALVTGGLQYKGLLDADVLTVFPSNPFQGDFYKISVAGSIDGVALSVGDMVIANQDVVGASSASDWDIVDNTESADILRDSDVSTNTDLTVDGTLLADRTTINSAIIAATSGSEIWSEQLTVTHNSPVVSDTVEVPTTGTVRAYLNGVRENDFVLVGSTITFGFNLKNSGGNVDTVYVDYKY